MDLQTRPSGGQVAAAQAFAPQRTIVLVGLMGAGKTKIGRRLAARLNLPFFDSDNEIEAAAGETIEEIFRNRGEAAFRDGERRVIARLLGRPIHVLATGGGAFMDEATRQAKDEFSIEVALAWENTLDAARTPDTRKIALRSAMVLGSGQNSVFPMLRRLVRLGLGGRMGNGRQFVSWIHERDFCRAIEWLLAEDDFRGPANLAAPNPVPNAELMRTLRKVCRMPLGLPATRWMLEVGAFFLGTETELIIKSRRVVPGRLLAAGFEFEFPHLRGALEDLCAKAPR